MASNLRCEINEIINDLKSFGPYLDTQVANGLDKLDLMKNKHRGIVKKVANLTKMTDDEATLIMLSLIHI